MLAIFLSLSPAGDSQPGNCTVLAQLEFQCVKLVFAPCFMLKSIKGQFERAIFETLRAALLISRLFPFTIPCRGASCKQFLPPLLGCYPIYSFTFCFLMQNYGENSRKLEYSIKIDYNQTIKK